MRRHSITILTTAIIYAATTAHAESGQFAEAKQAFTSIKENLIKMAESMPEADYSFKPTPEIRSFGEMVAHVANAQAGICSMASAEKKSVGAKGTATKSELVAALKESATICDAAWDGLTPASAAETVKMGKTERSKLGVLTLNSMHDNEEYGYMAVYLRLKGVVPPSSAK